MVKDVRSSWETSNVDGVLDGKESFEEFVGVLLWWTVDEGEGRRRKRRTRWNWRCGALFG